MFSPGVAQRLGVDKCLQVLPKHWQTLFVVIFPFSTFFLPFVFTKEDLKPPKKLIFDHGTCAVPICWSKCTTGGSFYRKQVILCCVINGSFLTGNQLRCQFCLQWEPVQILSSPLHLLWLLQCQGFQCHLWNILKNILKKI